MMRLNDLDIETDDQVYTPREDTYFFVDTLLTQNLVGPLVEVGVGTGAVSLTIAKNGVSMIGTDVNMSAALLAHANAERNNVDLQVVCTDLFRCFRPGAFSTVVSNPPYLPADDSVDPYLDPHERLALVGGSRGTEMTESLLQYAQRVSYRTAYIILSSLATDPVSFQRRVGYDIKVVATLPLGLETLWVLMIRE